MGSGQRIDEQIALVNAQLEGKKAELTRTKTVVNKETGERSKITAEKSVRAWYWPQNGKFLLIIRYGTHTLQFAKGTNAIETTSLKSLVSVLSTIKTAVANGELDAAINAASPRREKKAHA